MSMHTRKEIAGIALTFLQKYKKGKAIALIVELLRHEQRLQEINLIISEMERQLYMTKKQLPIAITSTHEIDKNLTRQIASFLQQKLQAESVTITHTIDPTVKGGFIARALDYEIDASIHNRLTSLEAV